MVSDRRKTFSLSLQEKRKEKESHKKETLTKKKMIERKEKVPSITLSFSDLTNLMKTLNMTFSTTSQLGANKKRDAEERDLSKAGKG